MCAPEDKRLEFAKYLLQKGCDINATDKVSFQFMSILKSFLEQKGMDMLFLTSYWTCKELFAWVLQQKDLILDRSNTAVNPETNFTSNHQNISQDLK